MAANRPMAVASSASAMPGATTASEVFFDAAMERNDVIMPQTVPKRPTNGPADAMVASTSKLDFEFLDLARDRNVEHLFDARLQTHEGGVGVLE